MVAMSSFAKPSSHGGRCSRRKRTIDHPTHETVTDFLDAVRARTPSWTWRVSQEQLDAALDVGRRLTIERFGSTDIRLEERIRQRWWVFGVS